MKTVAPEFTMQEMKGSIEAEAKRWEEMVMKELTAPPPAPIDKQSELAEDAGA